MENIRKIEAEKNNCGFYKRLKVIEETTDESYKQAYCLEYAAKKELLELCRVIDKQIDCGIKSYVRIGYYLKLIRDRNLVAETGYKNIYEFAYGCLGISKAFCLRLIAVAERFFIVEIGAVGVNYTRVGATSHQKTIDMVKTSCAENYHSLDGFSISKLIELLPLSDKMITLYVKDPRMTVAELRQLVANLNYSKVDDEKRIAEQNERLDEEVKDIEPAYNPRKYYDFAYFKSKTKEQLINIVMDLQRTYIEQPKNF